jgi:hypothetical protein
MHLHALLISTGPRPLIGLDEMYEAPAHHLQKARGDPKSFLMATRAGSVELHEGFAAGAAPVNCPKARAQTSQVIKSVGRNMVEDK